MGLGAISYAIRQNVDVDFRGVPPVGHDDRPRGDQHVFEAVKTSIVGVGHLRFVKLPTKFEACGLCSTCFIGCKASQVIEVGSVHGQN